MKGDRKSRNSTQTQLILLCGFAVAVYAKADASVFTTFVVGLVGASGTFMWGNAQEHKQAAVVAAAASEVKP